MPVRLAWIAIGFIALGLGALGALLPLLPTTPFVLLAAFAFGKGSPRLHAWLEAHRVFGPVIRDWRDRGAIARRHKAMACSMMILTLFASVLAGLAPVILLVQALCMGAAATFIVTRPA